MEVEESRGERSHLPSYISVQVPKAVLTMLPCCLENLFLSIKVETEGF